MRHQKAVRYALCLVLCFLLGCAAAFALHQFDRAQENVAPLTGGQVMDWPTLGVSLRVPEDFVLTDRTAEHRADGGQAQYCGQMRGASGELVILCYANAAGDAVTDYDAQTLVTTAMRAGFEDVRLRELAGNRFLCYRTPASAQSARALWYTYVTWDAQRQLHFETPLPPAQVLPILATLQITSPDLGL